MTIGKKSVLRKNSFSNRLLCVFIAIALALLLVPAASIKAIAENNNTGEEVNQATEQSTEGAAEEQNADGTTDAKAEENATDSDSANLQANEGDNTEDANNDNQNPNADEPVNAGGTITVGFDSTSGLSLYRKTSDKVSKLTETDTQQNITDVKIIYSDTYKCNVLQCTQQISAEKTSTIYYLGQSEDETTKGEIFSKDTGDFLTTSYSDTLSEGKTLNFATTLPSTATIKTPESGTITASKQTKAKLTYGTVYKHEAGSNTITFKYGGTALATYTAAPTKEGYVLDDFWVTTDEAGTKKLDSGSAISTDNIWLWASFKNENIKIDFGATPTAGGKVSPATVQAKTGWSCKVEGNKITFYDEETTEQATVTATANKGYVFSKFTYLSAGTQKELKDGTYEELTIFSGGITANFDVTHNITLDYKKGAPSSIEKLKGYGWSYDTEKHIASQAFKEGTNIKDVFAEGSTVWSDECEPVLEGYTYEWSPARSGTLSKDFNTTALYTANQVEIKAASDPTKAATMSIAPSSKVNYGDKVAEVTATNIKIKRGDKEVATISYEINEGYMFSKWIAKNSKTGEVIDLATLKTTGITTGVTFVAAFEKANALSVTYAKSTVVGQTTKKLEAAGWTAVEDYFGLHVTYSKLFKTGSSIAYAVDSFNNVEGAAFAKTDTTYKRAIYQGTETVFTQDVEMTPIFTFNLVADPPKAGTGTLVWDTIDPAVETVDFVTATYETVDTDESHIVKFTEATYFDSDTGTVKTYNDTGKFNLKATPNTEGGYIFGKWNFEELSGKITKNTNFGVTFDKTWKISMCYGDGLPIKTSTLEYYGWEYDTESHVATQSFVAGSDIAKIFEEYWSANCEPTLEGYTASWDKPLKGKLDSDKVFSAEYTPIVKHVTAAVDKEHPEAAKVKVTPDDPAPVQYWDRIRINEDNSIDVIRGTLITKVVASIAFEESTSWAFKSWAAYDTNTGEQIDIEKLKTDGIKQDITFVATFEQKFVCVKFDDTYFKERGGRINYVKGETSKTYTEGFVASIPQNYKWYATKSAETLANADIIQFINPDNGEIYSSATLVSTRFLIYPYGLYADEAAQVYGVGDYGYAYKSFTIYPTVFGESDYVTVTASVSDETMGSVKCYQGETELTENTIQASQPLEYTQEERGEVVNTLTINSKVGNNFYIKTTNADKSKYYFLGWAYSLDGGTSWKWLEDKAGKLNVDAQVMAVYTEPIDVTFEVNKEERGTVEGETELIVKVPGENTTKYKYDNNKVILYNDTYGYTQEVTATPNEVEEHMYLFKEWDPATSEGTITGETTFTAIFKEDFKVTMNAGEGGEFGVAPKGWTSEPTENGEVQYWKNFEEKTLYKTIEAEWEGYEPTKVGHTFSKWNTATGDEKLVANTKFTAYYTPNKYKASFYLNGGKPSQVPAEPTNWKHNATTDTYYNEEDFVYGNLLSKVTGDFAEKYGTITREDYTPTGEYYVYPEQVFFSQDTLFVPKYSYELSVKSGEHGSVSPEEWSKSRIDEYDKTEITIADDGVLTLTINNAESGTPEVKAFVPSTEEGYQFANWTDKNGKELKTGDELVGNNEITANFELKEYNVSFFSGNPTLGEVNTTPESPQQITHFSKLIICKDEYKNYAYINKGGTETKVFEAWAVPEKETEARTYYFDNWTIMYPGGEITVDPSEGAEYTIEGPIDVRANFSQDYHRYNVLASIYTWDEPEGYRSSINPEIWHNVPYGSKAVANNHMVVITTPDQQMKTIECTPGTYSTQTAWYFGAEKMEEGVEYTITGTSLFTAELCEGSILRGQVTEQFTGYTLQDVYLTFVYDNQTNGLDEEIVGPIVCDENGYYEFEDPRIKAHASGTLYTFCAGYEVASKDLYIESGENEVPVEMKIQSGDLNMVSEAEGHNCFDVTFEGTVTKQSGAVHKQEAEIHTTVPGTYTSLISGETYKGTTFTFNEDSISTYYEAEMVPEETNADVEKYYEQSQIVPVAKDGYKFSHFIYNDKEVAPGEKITIEANEEYNISAVYEVVPVDALGTGTGSTGDSNWVLFLIVGLVLVAAGVGIGYGLYRKNKGNAASKSNSSYTPKH